MSKAKQQAFFKLTEKAYGGTLQNSRAGRLGPRPLHTKNTMHLILKSSKAVGPWSFRSSRNEKQIKVIIRKFSSKFGVKILSLANVGNHLHFQIKLTNRFTYIPFIRAVTAAIAMAITGNNKWNPTPKTGKRKNKSERFWDYRPFSRIVFGRRGFLTLRDYININQLEGFGLRRDRATLILKMVNAKGEFSSA